VNPRTANLEALKKEKQVRSGKWVVVEGLVAELPVGAVETDVVGQVGCDKEEEKIEP